VSTFPPFLFSGIRQLLAGGILLIGLKLFGKLNISKSTLKKQLLLGILLISLGNGTVGWSERFIPSGLAALIVSILPVYIISINYITRLEKRKPDKYIILGLVLGCSGIVLIFKDNLKDFINPHYLIGTLVAFGACLSWAAGSVYSKHKLPKGNIISNAALQMFFGGIILMVFSLLMDDYSELKTIDTESIWALGYLVVIGSVLAYPCYVYALEKLPIGIVSMYAYINPFIALLLGYLLLDETITWITVAALICVSGGIYYINKGYQSSSIAKDEGNYQLEKNKHQKNKI
jgi:drug/metabolite transporter (DMT)-like permease